MSGQHGNVKPVGLRAKCSRYTHSIERRSTRSQKQKK